MFLFTKHPSTVLKESCKKWVEEEIKEMKIFDK